MIRITTNAPSTKRLVRKLQRELDPARQSLANKHLLQATARELRDRIRKKLSSGGEGRWTGLSQWTKNRTGRSKPLTTLAPRVKYAVRGATGKVFFERSSPEWDLTSHHRGFHVSETVGKTMVIPQGGGFVVLRRRKAYNVPARPVWPDPRTVTIVLNRHIRALQASIDRVR